MTLDAKVAHDALVHGFGWVMLYGGIGVWLLAAASFVTFGAMTAKVMLSVDRRMRYDVAELTAVHWSVSVVAVVDATANPVTAGIRV